MDTTANLKLNKPAPEDFYDVGDFNENADVIDEEITKKADAQTVTGGFVAGRGAGVATVEGTALEYMYIGQWKDGTKLSYVSGNPTGLFDKNNTTPSVNSGAQIFNVFDLGQETNISAITLYVSDGGASQTNMVRLLNELPTADAPYLEVLRTNGQPQNGVPVIENKLSSDGYIKVGYMNGTYIGKYRYIAVYDWSNICSASELYVETDTVETPIPAIQLGEGTNDEPYSFQVYDYQMTDADGHIPEERLYGDNFLGKLIRENEKPLVVYYEGDYTSADLWYVKKALIFYDGELYTVENCNIGYVNQAAGKEYVEKLALVGPENGTYNFRFYLEGNEPEKPDDASPAWYVNEFGEYRRWKYYTQQGMLESTETRNPELVLPYTNSFLEYLISKLIEKLAES